MNITQQGWSFSIDCNTSSSNVGAGRICGEIKGAQFDGTAVLL